jgi:predicted PurR-regulated permease PerM
MSLSNAQHLKNAADLELLEEPVRPQLSPQQFYARASQIAVVGLFIIALITVMHFAQHVVVPLLLAWAVATVMLPAINWLKKAMPRGFAVAIVTSVTLSAVGALAFVLSAPLAYWLGRATYVGALIREKIESFTQPLALLRELQKGLSIIGTGESSTIKVEQSSSILTTIWSVLTPTVGGIVLFLGALVFYLLYQENLRRAVIHIVHNREAKLAMLRVLNEVDENMSRYFGTFTLINIALGMVATALAWATGLPNPLLWGVLACVLNYIPYIGPSIVMVTLLVVGLLVHPSLGEAAIAPLVYLAIVAIEGQFLTPMLMGKNLELNPFAVFLAIAFCAWLWGPLGAFLAVPLLMTLSVTLGQIFRDDEPAPVLPH